MAVSTRRAASGKTLRLEPFPQNQRIRKSLIDMTFQNSNRQKLLRGASVDVRRWAVFPLRGRQHGDIDSAV
jgi:hypothetical protein